MSFAFGMKSDKSFIAATSDGVTANSIWFNNGLLSKGAWHDIKYSFNEGKIELLIDGNVVYEGEAKYKEIFNSIDTNFKLGESLQGRISDFYCYFE